MQLPLPVTLPTDETFASFVDTGNKEVIWALTFYLSEKHSTGYYAYLRALSRLEGLRTYVSSRRVADFEKYFGDDWRMLESKAEDFMKTL